MLYSIPRDEVCIEAWLQCENVLMEIPKIETTEKKGIQKVFSECADICLGMLHALKSGSENTNKIALLCVGICEECAEICDQFQFQPLYKKCAAACRNCADALALLALTSIATT